MLCVGRKEKKNRPVLAADDMAGLLLKKQATDENTGDDSGKNDERLLKDKTERGNGDRISGRLSSSLVCCLAERKEWKEKDV